MCECGWEQELQDSLKPSIVKAVWDLVEIFYVDKNSASWLPERLVDWVAVSLQTPFSHFTQLWVC